MCVVKLFIISLLCQSIKKTKNFLNGRLVPFRKFTVFRYYII